jgi:hypothetical protein
MLRGGKVVKDKLAKDVIKQGFGDDIVAMIKASNPKTRAKFLHQLRISRKGKQNAVYAAQRRPLETLGDSVLARVKVVWESNRLAGRRLDNVAKSLKGHKVDVSPVVDDFLAKLDNMGIKFDPSTGKTSFMDSDIEGLGSAERAVNQILKRMHNTKSPDAYDVHRLKRYIDNNVEYGKSSEGLLGQVEGVVKGLRHDLDAVLDSTFPAYNQVNTQYAETIHALDALQDVAGKKMNLHGENAASAVGTLSRRLLSNAQSRINLLDALVELDEMAKKYATSKSKELVPYGKHLAKRGTKLPEFSDGMIEQAVFANELDRLFGAAAKTSLMGDEEKVASVLLRGKSGMIEEGVRAGARKLGGISEENAFEAMEQLLKRGAQ